MRTLHAVKPQLLPAGGVRGGGEWLTSVQSWAPGESSPRDGSELEMETWVDQEEKEDQRVAWCWREGSACVFSWGSEYIPNQRNSFSEAWNLGSSFMTESGTPTN